MITQPMTLALHFGGEHGIASPWILIPAALYACIYYLRLHLGAKAKAGLARLLGGDSPETVRVGSVRAPLFRGPFVFEEVRISGAQGLPPGWTILIRRASTALAVRPLLGGRLEAGPFELSEVELHISRGGGTDGEPEDGSSGDGSSWDGSSLEGASKLPGSDHRTSERTATTEDVGESGGADPGQRRGPAGTSNIRGVRIVVTKEGAEAAEELWAEESPIPLPDAWLQERGAGVSSAHVSPHTRLARIPSLGTSPIAALVGTILAAAPGDR